MKTAKNKILILLRSIGFVFPPILMAVFPLLSFYFNNITELSMQFLIKPLYYSIAICLAATLLLSFLLKNKQKAALIVTLFTLIFFSYGHLSKALDSRLFIELPNKTVLGPDKILLPITAIIFAFIAIKIMASARKVTQIIVFLNISLIALIGYLGLAIGKIEFQKNTSSVDQPEQTLDTTHPGPKNKPDIYYIVLDGYARNDILRDVYQYDNTGFTNELKKLGFYVADQARSNYVHTYLSLPSTLNMRYLDDLPRKYGTKPVDGTAAKKLAADNEVTRKLKSYGYTVINFASAWEGTNEDFKADKTYKKDQYFKVLGRNLSIDEVYIAFMQTTLLSPLINEIWADTLRARTLTTLQKLPVVPYEKETKFTVAHILAPHPPYVFTAQGDSVPGAETEFADESIDKRPRYRDQLIFISKQIIPVISKIIQNSAQPPIIILQSDHGPGSFFGKRDDWLENYSEEGVRERSGILYAVYFPDKDYRQFYDSITPVNTFRILFNQYFDEILELLPDKTFYTSYENIYGFKDVTGIK